MTLINTDGIIGKQTFTAKSLPKTGDREETILNVQGPDPRTSFEVPITFTGTILAMWNNPNPIEVAESLGKAIFSKRGTASLPPDGGYWFDSYNSKENVYGTAQKIYNEGDTPFILNNKISQFYIKAFGQDIADKIKTIDSLFENKIGYKFFDSLELMTELSEIQEELDIPCNTKHEYIFKICILAGVIDMISVKPSVLDFIKCPRCGENTKKISVEPSLSKLTRLIKEYVDIDDITPTLYKIRQLRNQFPIHNSYEILKGKRVPSEKIEKANLYFGITEKKDYSHNFALILQKFGYSLDSLIKLFGNI